MVRSNQQRIKGAAPFEAAGAADPVVLDGTVRQIDRPNGGDRREVAVWTSHSLCRDTLDGCWRVNSIGFERAAESKVL